MEGGGLPVLEGGSYKGWRTTRGFERAFHRGFENRKGAVASREWGCNITEGPLHPVIFAFLCHSPR